MGFAKESGYTPVSVETIMADVMANVNTQFGTTYTTETFIGTNYYKFFYTLIQRIQANETRTAEIFSKLQQYFNVTNEAVSRPVTTFPGVVEKLEDEGYIASIKQIDNTDAGKVYICVDVDDGADDYADTKLAICEILAASVVAGAVTQGTETESIVISNGQSFDFKYALPDKHPTLLRLTLTLSENNQSLVGDPDDVKETLLTNIAAKYKLGKNFEPKTYFTVVDAPWCGDILLEYSINSGADWLTDVYEANFDDLLTFALEDIDLIEE